MPVIWHPLLFAWSGNGMIISIPILQLQATFAVVYAQVTLVRWFDRQDLSSLVISSLCPERPAAKVTENSSKAAALESRNFASILSRGRPLYFTRLILLTLWFKHMMGVIHKLLGTNILHL